MSEDCMNYLPGMEAVDPDIMERVDSYAKSIDFSQYTPDDVKRALNAQACTPDDFAALLSEAAVPLLEAAARRARRETRARFGNSVTLFTPLYIANYCENQCVYCGFSRANHIRRARLSAEGIEREMAAIAASGLEEILILTGESHKMSDIAYIGNACRIARRHFRVIGVEVYPMDSSDYAYLHSCGVDFVTVFQETYDRGRYGEFHPAGRKRVFPYRFNAQERALNGGVRGVGFAALLGLSDFRRDAFATGLHAFLIQKKYPHAEISFSCPRLRPIKGGGMAAPHMVSESELFQVMCAYRIFMPSANITISSRESARFRDNVVGIAATKISAGVDVGVGGRVGECAAVGMGGSDGGCGGLGDGASGRSGACEAGDAAGSVSAGERVNAAGSVAAGSVADGWIGEAGDAAGSVSAGERVNTAGSAAVGSVAEAGSAQGDEQFEIDDGRSVAEIRSMLEAQGLQPVMSEYVYV